MDRANEKSLQRKLRREKMQALLDAHRALRAAGPALDPARVFTAEERALFEDAKFLRARGFLR